MPSKKTKLFIALTTTHGIMPSQFLGGMLELAVSLPCPAQIQQFMNCYVNLSSNVAASVMLDTDSTHFMLSDVDIMLTRTGVTRLLLHEESIVGAFFPKKIAGKPQWVCNSLPHKPEPDYRGLLELSTIGFGCIVIKREVFEKMRDTGTAKPYFEYESDMPLWDFFPMGIKGRNYRTHDWGFCDNARDLEYKIYGDTQVRFGHYGGIVYPVDPPKEDEIRK